MSDIRSLLRSELATRNSQSSASTITTTSKKRKANTEQDSDPRASFAKKSRSVRFENQQKPQKFVTLPKRLPNYVASPPELDTVPEEDVEILTDEPATALDVADIKDADTAGAVDEDEWAAFERDVATPPPDTVPVSALHAPASIEAKPLSAAEVAAQAREEESNQKGRKDVEAEEEKEDAARRLEEEFEEMEGLEDRVKRLRERREALRRGSEGDEDAMPQSTGKNMEESQERGGTSDAEEAGYDEDDNDAEAEEDWMWRR